MDVQLQNTGLDALADIWRPNGYLLLVEAAHWYGQWRFGNDWTGEEVFLGLTEPQEHTVERYRSLLSTSEHFRIEHVPVKRNRRHSAKAKWEWELHFPFPCMTTRLFKSEEAAKKGYATAMADLVARHEARVKALPGRRQAVKRLNAVVSEMRAALHDGSISAATHSPSSGDIAPLKPKFWASESAPSLFSLPYRESDEKKRLEEVTANRLPEKTTDVRILVLEKSLRPPAPDRAPKKASQYAVDTWYANYVKEWPEEVQTPSEVDDFEAAKKHFNRNVARVIVRKARKKLAPHEWKKTLPKTRRS